MFDLEGAIAQWRERLSWRDAFTDADLNEMESHLRDEIEALVVSGTTEQDAFFQTVRTFDEDIKLAFRFNQANWEKVLIKRTRYAPTLIGNYFKVAIRNLLKRKVYSFINITGLAVGLTGAILILLYVQQELRYDRHHEHANRIYRVIREIHNDNGPSKVLSPGTSGALAPALKDAFPEIQEAVRVGNRWQTWVRHEDKGFYEYFCVTDANIFDVFSIPLIKGDPQTALKEPYSILITESAAQRYFGDEDPIGKVIVPDSRPLKGTYTITGILKDMPKTTFSRFCFTFLTFTRSPAMEESWSKWLPTQFRYINTYVLLSKNCDPKTIEQKLSTFMAQHMGDDIAARNTYYLQPLTRIHLYSKVDYNLTWYNYGNITPIYLISAIALFLVIIACVNFMNLATAQSATRAKETGLRKTLGAQRWQLITQFLSESMLITFFSLVFALFLTELTLPFFQDIVGKAIPFDIPSLLPSLMIITLFVGLFSGSYPAFFLSAFRSADIVKGNLNTSSGGKQFRKVLVIFQFAISIFLIIGTTIVYQQLTYINNKDIGFDKENFVSIWPRWNKGHENVKQEYLAHPNVLAATASWESMHDAGMSQIVHPEGTEGTQWRMHLLSIDEDFLDAFNIPIVAGRNFSKEVPTDATSAFMLNETAVKMLGWTDPIGKQFAWGDKKGYVIGVVKDINIASLHKKIRPTFLCKDRLYTLSLKIKSDQVAETMQFLKEKTAELRPNRGFEYVFLDDAYDAKYRSEQQFGQITSIFSSLAIFIACLGLFGLIAFTIQQRTKEIGIRKTLGASEINIVKLLSQDVIKWVLIANIIAWPIAHYAMQQWLQGFAYHIDVAWWPFALSGLMALGLALFTVFYQSLKAARSNPVDALRYE